MALSIMPSELKHLNSRLKTSSLRKKKYIYILGVSSMHSDVVFVRRQRKKQLIQKMLYYTMLVIA